MSPDGCLEYPLSLAGPHQALPDLRKYPSSHRTNFDILPVANKSSFFLKALFKHTSPAMPDAPNPSGFMIAIHHEENCRRLTETDNNARPIILPWLVSNNKEDGANGGNLETNIHVGDEWTCIWLADPCPLA